MRQCKRTSGTAVSKIFIKSNRKTHQRPYIWVEIRKLTKSVAGLS